MTDRQRSPYLEALKMAWDMGYLIVIPLVLFGLAGRYADQRFHTSPWLFLAGLLVSIVITTFALVRKFAQIVKDMEGQSKHEQ